MTDRPNKGTSRGLARTFQAGPSAASLIEGLRDFGYTLETALADIVDNSISADAKRIDIMTAADEAGFRLAVLDNGRGMSESELRAAMRLASHSPLEERDPGDLGRFGLGLKTASFSQCRRLTVVTRRAGELHAATWDIDYVVAHDDWLILETEDPCQLPWTDRIADTGTLVIWENLDRVVKPSANSRNDQVRFTKRLSGAATHLELVFHRFLVREGSNGPVVITLNARPLAPYDPFASSNPATIVGPPDFFRRAGGLVGIQSFTLPHHSKASRTDWERLGGPEGYVKNQGFYVYRARRLIVWGTWFGIIRQSEQTKLARVLIDLPNGMDDEWKINVLKASAQPPEPVKDRLRRLIDEIVGSSKRVYRHKGAKQTSKAEIPVWRRVQEKTGISYQPDIDHPAVQSLVDQLSLVQRQQLLSVLNLLGKTLPVDALLLDMTDNPDQVSDGHLESDQLAVLTESTARELRDRGATWVKVRRMMKSSPPFEGQWDETKKLLDDLEKRL